MVIQKILKKQIPQNLIFRCGMTHLNYSLRKLGEIFNLQKEKLKAEMIQIEVYSDTWIDKVTKDGLR